MSSPENETERLGFTVAALSVIALVVLVKLPWSQSLWLDETISIWIDQSSLQEVWNRSIQFQGQSPFYFIIPWIVTKLGLESELWFRLPSILMVAISAFLVFKIARLYFLKSIALFCVICFIALDPVQVAAISARPYSLALLLTAALTLTWLSWSQRPSNKHIILYTVLTCLLFYAHYLFVVVPCIHLASSFVLYPTQLKTSFKAWLVAMGSSFVIMTPGFFQVANLAGRKTQLSFSAAPSFIELIKALVPPYFLVYFFMGSALVLIMGYGRGLHFPRYKYGRPQVVWAGFAVGVLGFYLFSIFSDSPIFLARLFLWYYLALALLAGYLVARISPLPFRSLAIMVICGFVFFRETLRVWHGEFWREEIKIVDAQNSQSPLLLYSGLIEAEQLGSSKNSEWIEYLRTPLVSYPYSGSVIDIPGEFNTESSGIYWETRVVPVIEQTAQGVVIAYRRNIPNSNRSTVDLIEEKLKALGKTVQRKSPQKAVVQRLEYKTKLK